MHARTPKLTGFVLSALVLALLALIPLVSCRSMPYQDMPEAEFAMLVDDMRAVGETVRLAEPEKAPVYEAALRTIADGTVTPATLASWSVDPIYSPLAQRLFARLHFYITVDILDDRTRALVLAAADGLKAVQ